MQNNWKHKPAAAIKTLAKFLLLLLLPSVFRVFIYVCADKQTWHHELQWICLPRLFVSFKIHTLFYI